LIKKQPDITEKRYALRINRYQGSIMISICDLELVGMQLKQEDIVVNITREYFEQEIIEERQALELLKSCSIANLVGERIVKNAIDLRLAKEPSIKRISGIPFLMLFKFQQTY
jgi:uncharacterized protein